MSGFIKDANTLALWRHDETIGNIVSDDTGNYPLTSTATIVPGAINNARDYNDSFTSSGPCDNALITALCGACTVEAIVQIRTLNSSNTIFQIANGSTVFFDCFVTSARSMRFFSSTGNSSGSISNVVSRDSWHYLAFVFNTNNTVDYYVDGLYINTNTLSRYLTPPFTTGTITLGNDPPFNTELWDGKLDEIRISNKVRTASEIFTTYQSFGVTTIGNPSFGSISSWPIDFGFPGGHVGYLVTNAPTPNLPTFSANFSSNVLQVTFSRDILDSTILTDSSNYSITAPLGSPTPSVTNIQVGSNYINLTLSTETLNGGTYSVSIAANTARAVDTGEGNASGSSNFTGSSTPPTVLSVKAESLESILVTFSKAVRQADPSASDDALNIANYSLDGGLSIINVQTVDSFSVRLTNTPPQTAGQSYTLTISNIKDIVGNTI